MTEHALERLSERYPDLDPSEALLEIKSAIARSEGFTHESVVSNQYVHEVWLESGPAVFAFVKETEDGPVVVTVLAEGMEHQSPTGLEVLKRSSLGEGLHYNIPEHAYHADPCAEPSLSSGLAKTLINHSPLHAWTSSRLLNPEWEPTIKRVFDFGHAAHAAVLGRGKTVDVVPKDVLGKGGALSTKAAKEFIAESRERGNVPLKQEEALRIAKMVAVFRDLADHMKVEFHPDHSEVVAIANVRGILNRAMIDNAHPDPKQPLRDFKTTTDCSSRAIEKKILDMGYDMQAAHYTDTWKAATGEDRDFEFWFQEKEPPFAMRVVRLTGDTLEMGRKRMRRARDIWRMCIKSDHWPGYPMGVEIMELPAWYQAAWLERETRELEFRQQHGRDILDAARKWQSPEGLVDV